MLPNPEDYVNFSAHTLADKSNAIIITHAKETIEINPDTKTTKGWPVLGITLNEEDHPDGWPPKLRITMSCAVKWEGRGLIEIKDRDVVASPAGPKNNPWKGGAGTRRNHEFAVGSAIVFKNNVNDPTDDVTYKIVRNPGKYYSKDGVSVTRQTIDRYGELCETHWDFLLEKV